MKSGFIKLLLFITLCALLASCGAKRERDELIDLAKVIEMSRPQGREILNRFNSIQQLPAPMSPQLLVSELSTLVLEIDRIVAPAIKLNPKSKEVTALREEYLNMWRNLQDGMKIILETMAKGDPKLIATLEKRAMEKNTGFFNAAQKFESDYIIIMRRHGITMEDLGIAQPQPSGLPQNTPPSP